MDYSDYRLYGIALKPLRAEEEALIYTLFEENTDDDCEAIERILAEINKDKPRIKKWLKFAWFRGLKLKFFGKKGEYTSFTRQKEDFERLMSMSDKEITGLYYEQFAMSRINDGDLFVTSSPM